MTETPLLQTDIFGEAHAPRIQPFKIARKVMDEKPMTWKSQRLLMKEVAKEVGFRWDLISPEQQDILEDLLDLAPDFERAARKIREEDAKLSKTMVGSDNY